MTNSEKSSEKAFAKASQAATVDDTLDLDKETVKDLDAPADNVKGGRPCTMGISTLTKTTEE